MHINTFSASVGLCYPCIITLKINCPTKSVESPNIPYASYTIYITISGKRLRNLSKLQHGRLGVGTFSGSAMVSGQSEERSTVPFSPSSSFNSTMQVQHMPCLFVPWSQIINLIEHIFFFGARLYVGLLILNEVLSHGVGSWFFIAISK
jgi:hypothetical protein